MTRIAQAALLAAALAAGVTCNATRSHQNNPEPASRATPTALNASGASPSTPNPYWSVAAWFVDPQDVSGNANDNNPCTTSVAPCLTYAKIAARWGGYSPILEQLTTVTFLSPHTNALDPVIAHATCINGPGCLVFKGALPTAAATGALTASAAKSRTAATVQTYSDTVHGASWSAGMLFTDAGGGGGSTSRTWCVNKSTSSTCQTSQPLAPASLPIVATGAGMALAEVNNAAASDIVSAYSLINVNIVDFSCSAMTYYSGGAPNLPCVMTQLNVYDPNGAGVDPISWGANVSGIEIHIDRVIALQSSVASAVDSGCVNCAFNGGLAGGSLSTGHYFRINGGVAFPNGTYNATGGIVLDGDFWVGTGMTFPQGVTLSLFNLQSVTGGGDLLSVDGTSYFAETSGGYGTLAMWGQQGTLNVTGKLKYDGTHGGFTGINVSTTPNPVTLNGQNSAIAFCNTGPPTVWYFGIGITNSAIDGACSSSSFGGRVYGLYGAFMGNGLL